MIRSSQGLTLCSPAIAANSEISQDNYLNTFGCKGKNLRPPLAWDGVPEQTRSLALTFYDEDAPTGSGFWHWVAYNFPADLRQLATGPVPTGVIEGNTDFGLPGYHGPCPPVGRRHRYTFYLHALDVTSLDVPANATAALTGFFIYRHTIARASLTVLAGPRLG